MISKLSSTLAFTVLRARQPRSIYNCSLGHRYRHFGISASPQRPLTPPNIIFNMVQANGNAQKIKLYTNHGCPYAHRAHIVLKELGLEYDEVVIDLDKPREPWYLEINPVGDITKREGTLR
jgi:hypothetical protein